MGCGSSTTATEPTSGSPEHRRGENNHSNHSGGAQHGESADRGQQHEEEEKKKQADRAPEQQGDLEEHQYEGGQDSALDPVPPPEEPEPVLPPPPPSSDPTTKDDTANKVRRKRKLSVENAGQEEEGLTGVGTAVCMGRTTVTLDTRQGAGQSPEGERPAAEDGPWADPDFPQQVAMRDIKDDIKWMRPREFCSAPQLFTEGTTRFDIQQGSAGTCWFLSILAALADKPNIIKQVIPDDAYTADEDGYDGVFHCRFWRFGKWLDIYIDDFLPTRSDGQGHVPWGARSCDDNELWVPLMEKAFAKFHGSYTAAYGGWAGDAFISLTGGVAERLIMDDISAKQLFSRVKNSLGGGAVIACSVPEDKDGEMGLVGGHAYTLTGAARVSGGRKKAEPLVRVRNPWGTSKGEWTGAWSDGSSEWEGVGQGDKDRLQVEGKGDGEFWMHLDDYRSYFRDTHICNFTPDFDKDGTTDGLDNVSCIIGEWRGATAAGKDTHTKFNNPKYMLTVPEKGVEDDGKVPVVIQFIQEREDRKDNDHYYIRADLYKVDAKCNPDGTHHMALDELTNNEKYFGGPSLSYRYRLGPGEHVLLPTTMEVGQEGQFCLRSFSSVSIACKQMDESLSVFVRRSEAAFEHERQLYEPDNLLCKFGSWISGHNAGGQVSNQSFDLNPQYLLSVAGGSRTPLYIALLQENIEARLSIGYNIFKIEDPGLAPLDLNWIYKNYEGQIQTTEGKAVFVQSYEAEGYFLLDPGNYVIILFTNGSGEEKKYALTMGTPEGTQLDIKEFNTAM